MIEVAIAVISTIAMFLPNLAEKFEEMYLRQKHNIAPGNIYNMINEALTDASAKGQKTANDLLTQLNTRLMSISKGGSSAYAKYVSEAKEQLNEKQRQISSKAIEASVYEQAANNLTNAYESLSGRSKNSSTGRAMRKGIKDNINKAVNAYHEVDPTIDTSHLKSVYNDYDAIEQPLTKQEAFDKIDPNGPYGKYGNKLKA